MKRVRVIGTACLLSGRGWALFVPLLLTAATTCAVAQATPTALVQVATSVEPRKVTVGTPFRYTMRVSAQSEVELVVPLLADRIGDFLITDFGEVPHQPDNGKLTIDRWYTLVTFEAGDKLIHGPAVQYRLSGSDLQSVDTPDALVIVESVLPADASKAEVRDIKPPVAAPRDYRPLWLAGAALVLVVGAGFGLYRLLNRRRAVGVKAPRPAHEVALEALARLRASRLLEEGRHKDYYVRLSAIVRHYLEDRFGLRAPEMTTEEFLQVAQQSPRLPRDQRTSLGRFLSEADLVKFARHVPEREDGEHAYAAARQFVESTRPQAEVTRAAA
jgi:hypothetical protein